MNEELFREAERLDKLIATYTDHLYMVNQLLECGNVSCVIEGQKMPQSFRHVYTSRSRAFIMELLEKERSATEAKLNECKKEFETL